MKGMHEIWYFDGRGQNSKFYKFENTLQRIYSTSNSFWQLIDTVKSHNRTGVLHGKSNWKKKMSLSRILHFYEISEITARRIFKGSWRTPIKIFCNLCSCVCQVSSDYDKHEYLGDKGNWESNLKLKNLNLNKNSILTW